MQIQLTLSHSRKARIWVDELPEDTLIGPARFVERRFPSNVSLGFSRKISIELFIPRGGRFDYGLIGGELVPNDADEFVITICHSARQPRPLVDSLAVALDDVLIDLPFDLADAVADGIVTADSHHASLPGSNLRVCHGAYGKLSSSVYFFRLLGKTFFRMITAPTIPSEDDERAEFFVDLLEGK